MRSEYKRLGKYRVVSILVFVELALDDYSDEVSSWKSLGFQSLFSWNLLLMGLLI